jgi:hypothetical protein
LPSVIGKGPKKVVPPSPILDKEPVHLVASKPSPIASRLTSVIELPSPDTLRLIVPSPAASLPFISPMRIMPDSGLTIAGVGVAVGGSGVGVAVGGSSVAGGGSGVAVGGTGVVVGDSGVEVAAACSGADIVAGASDTGVGALPPHPTKNKITKTAAIPTCNTC